MDLTSIALSDPSSSVRQFAPASEFLVLEFLDHVAEFERRPQLQRHVLHHHLAVQQEEGLAVDLLQGRRIHYSDSMPVTFHSSLQDITVGNSYISVR